MIGKYRDLAKKLLNAEVTNQYIQESIDKYKNVATKVLQDALAQAISWNDINPNNLVLADAIDAMGVALAVREVEIHTFYIELANSDFRIWNETVDGFPGTMLSPEMTYLFKVQATCENEAIALVMAREGITLVSNKL